MKMATRNVVELSNAVFLGEVKKLVAEGHDVTLRVKGVSMRPFLEDQRDKIVLTRITLTPQVGDAVLAEIAPGKYVFHRIIAITGSKVTLKGDGNVWGTEECRIENVVASTLTFVRRGKHYSPQGRAWRYYSALWPKWLFARRVLLKLYKIFRCYR
jgi:hypothetical protein